MKNRSRFLVSCLTSLLISSVGAGSLMAVQGDPTGSISTDRTTVLSNSIVTVTWNANYPAPPVNPPVKKTRADVRVVGAAFGPSSKPYPVRCWAKTSVNTSWSQIFLGNSNTVNPQTVVWSKVLAVGERLDFKFQGSTDNNYDLSKISSIGDWQTAIDTTSTSPFPWNRSVLIDGQSSPNYNPAFDQEDVHSHLKAYFYPGTVKVKIGPQDFFYLTELSNFSQGNTQTDMQDLVLLVTFTEIVTP